MLNLNDILEHSTAYEGKSPQEIQAEIKPILNMCYQNPSYRKDLALKLKCTWYAIDKWGRNVDPVKPDYIRYVKMLVMIQNMSMKEIEGALSVIRNDVTPGIAFSRKEKKWVASIRIKRVTYRLGLYDTRDDAIKARKEAKEEL